MARFKFGKRDIRKMERERDIEAIISLLDYEDDEVVFKAIEALTRIGDPSGVEAMMRLVADLSCSDIIRAKAWLALDVGMERESKKRTDWK
ncbi:MAG: HEAT repeat domain-containing protein [Actinomycetota bacterium]|nr:HEAT repeat domain-containing protein [Actinomycetota bacterium]